MNSEEYLPLVRLVAERMHHRLPPGIDLEALVHAGIVGLSHALQHMASSYVRLFPAYARYRVQREILAYLRSLDWVSQAIRTWGRQVVSVRLQLAEKLHRDATVEEIATALGVSVDEYTRCCQHAEEAKLLSLEELSLASDEEWQRIQNEFATHPLRDPLLFLRDRHTIDKISDALGELTENERLVISLSYYDELTPKEIGEIFHLTEDQVWQSLWCSMRRLQQTVQSGEELQT